MSSLSGEDSDNVEKKQQKKTHIAYPNTICQSTCTNQANTQTNVNINLKMPSEYLCVNTNARILIHWVVKVCQLAPTTR